jgi:hypothetical protein
LRRYKIRKSKAHELPIFPVKYLDEVVDIAYPENPQEGKCDACGISVKDGVINITYMDHWVNAYRAVTVRKDPYKALENLSELCFKDHNLMVSLKKLFGKIRKKNLGRLVKVGLLMPRDMKDKVDWFARAWLNARKTDKKERLEDYFR